jgi:hypothetical protein
LRLKVNFSIAWISFPFGSCEVEQIKYADALARRGCSQVSNFAFLEFTNNKKRFKAGRLFVVYGKRKIVSSLEL